MGRFDGQAIQGNAWETFRRSPMVGRRQTQHDNANDVLASPFRGRKVSQANVSDNGARMKEVTMSKDVDECSRSSHCSPAKVCDFVYELELAVSFVTDECRLVKPRRYDA